MSVYFIQAVGGGPIKIGHAKSVTKRLSTLQTGSGVQLRVLHEIRGGAIEEQGFHGALRQHRIKGEWFKPHPEVLDCNARLKGEKPRELAGTQLTGTQAMKFATGFFNFIYKVSLEEDELGKAAREIMRRYAEDKCGLVRADHLQKTRGE
jgi:hypothetical protein